MENAVINSYETLFITDVSAGEEATKATIDKFTTLIGNNAEIVEVSEWGKRRLAYLINDMSEGAYTVVTYKAAPSFISELERLFNIDESIMRSLTVKLEFDPAVKKTVVPASEEKSETEEVAQTEEVADTEAEKADTAEAADEQ